MAPAKDSGPRRTRTTKRKIETGTGPTSPGKKYQRYETKDLLLDPVNPRTIELGINDDSTQEQILEALWTKMAVREVALSIAHNGYFEHEPLFIEDRDGTWYVIEGNRRLASVQLLLNATLRRKLKVTGLPDIDAIDPGRRLELSTLPAVVTTHEEIWRYLGFKHVNGPSTWNSYAKAKYAARVHNNYGKSLKDIALIIGDTNATVERQYHGLMVIEQAEEQGLFDREDAAKGKFFFNYIYTGLNYPGFKKYLGISPGSRKKQKPVPKKKMKQLGELCLWLYGSRKKNIESVIRSQNPDLKTLDSVLQSPEGVRTLRDGMPLALAHDVSLGDEQLFKRALREAKGALQKARGTLSTGFDPGDKAPLETAMEISQIAEDLVEEMFRLNKKKKKKKKRQRKWDGEGD